MCDESFWVGDGGKGDKYIHAKTVGWGLVSFYLFTLVMGPEMLCLCPDTELPGLDWARDLKGVMDCDTPDASVNCSRSSTFVRPLAIKTGEG